MSRKDDRQRRAFQARWLKKQPKVIQDLAKAWPVDKQFMIEDVKHGIMGYTQGGALIVTDVDPTVDYAKAWARRKFVCAGCLAAGRLHDVTQEEHPNAGTA